jgi:site-specific recombinase XerC
MDIYMRRPWLLLAVQTGLRLSELTGLDRDSVVLGLRHEHRAGEKTFVDYAGQTVPVTDPKTGEVRQAQVFVAVLGGRGVRTWRSRGG